MKCLILAAGYATRLYPLTENFPKPLLEVQGKTILDWLIEDIGGTETVVVTNHRFAPIFEDWAKAKANITVLDDGTSSNETRLGAVCDIRFGVEQCGPDDYLVIAGDNLLDFSLRTLVDYAQEKGTSCVMRYREEDEGRLRHSGVAEVDDAGRILSFEEKPQNPKSHWCTPPFYYYTASDVEKISEAIAEGCGTDAPGSLVAWLCRNSVVHSMEMPGKRYDIGDIRSYEAVKREYHGRKNK